MSRRGPPPGVSETAGRVVIRGDKVVLRDVPSIAGLTAYLANCGAAASLIVEQPNVKLCQVLEAAVPVSSEWVIYTNAPYAPIDDKTGCALAAALKVNSSVQHLKVNFSVEDVCGDKTGYALATALKGGTSLQHFEFDCTENMGDKTGCALAAALKRNTSLQHFVLNVGKTFMGYETGRALAAALKLNTSLHHFELDCGETSMGDETGCALAEALKLNSSLHHFDFDCMRTYMGDETGCALATALKLNTSLRHCDLSLGGTSMGDETGCALAAALKGNTSLRHFVLYCWRTYMGDETGCALATALKLNTSLHHFELVCMWTSMGDETGCALAAALKVNTSLRHFVLNLAGTSMGDETGCALAAALKGNTSLQYIQLNLGNSSMGDETFCALASTLDANIQIRSFKMDFHRNEHRDRVQFLLQRNAQFRVEWSHVQLLLRRSSGFLFAAGVFGELGFASMLLAYLTPPSCVLTPCRVFPNGSRDVRTDAPPQNSDTNARPAGVQALVSDPTACLVSGADAEAAKDPLDANEALMAAMQRSLADAPPARTVRSRDGVVLLKLTHMAHCPTTLKALETADELEDCRRMVHESGCDVAPEGDQGPKFFVPAVVETVRDDLAREGIDLQGHHILIHESDVEKLEAALRKVPRKMRAGLHPHIPAVEDDAQDFVAEEQEEPFVLEHAFPATDTDLFYPEYHLTDSGSPFYP